MREVFPLPPSSPLNCCPRPVVPGHFLFCLFGHRSHQMFSDPFSCPFQILNCPSLKFFLWVPFACVDFSFENAPIYKVCVLAVPCGVGCWSSGRGGLIGPEKSRLDRETEIEGLTFSCALFGAAAFGLFRLHARIRVAVGVVSSPMKASSLFGSLFQGLPPKLSDVKCHFFFFVSPRCASLVVAVRDFLGPCSQPRK